MQLYQAQSGYCAVRVSFCVRVVKTRVFPLSFGSRASIVLDEATQVSLGFR